MHNIELWKYMKNDKHFKTVLGKKSKRNTLNTEGGIRSLDMIGKLSFYIDTLQMFKEEQFRTFGKDSLKELQAKRDVSNNAILAVYNMWLYSPKIWETSVYVGMDIMTYVNSIGFFVDNRSTNRGSQAVVLPAMDNLEKDIFGNYKERAFDRRFYRFSHEIRCLGDNLGNVLRKRMTTFGDKLCRHLGAMFGGMANLHSEASERIRSLDETICQVDDMVYGILEGDYKPGEGYNQDADMMRKRAEVKRKKHAAMSFVDGNGQEVSREEFELQQSLKGIPSEDSAPGEEKKEAEEETRAAASAKTASAAKRSPAKSSSLAKPPSPARGGNKGGTLGVNPNEHTANVPRTPDRPITKQNPSTGGSLPPLPFSPEGATAPRGATGNPTKQVTWGPVELFRAELEKEIGLFMNDFNGAVHGSNESKDHKASKIMPWYWPTHTDDRLPDSEEDDDDDDDGDGKEEESSEEGEQAGQDDEEFGDDDYEDEDDDYVDEDAVDESFNKGDYVENTDEEFEVIERLGNVPIVAKRGSRQAAQIKKEQAALAKKVVRIKREKTGSPNKNNVIDLMSHSSSADSLSSLLGKNVIMQIIQFISFFSHCFVHR